MQSSRQICIHFFGHSCGILSSEMVWCHKFAFARKNRNVYDVNEKINEDIIKADKVNHLKTGKDVTNNKEHPFSIKGCLLKDKFETLHRYKSRTSPKERFSRRQKLSFRPISGTAVDKTIQALIDIHLVEAIPQSLHPQPYAASAMSQDILNSCQSESATSIYIPFLTTSLSSLLPLSSAYLTIPHSPSQMDSSSSSLTEWAILEEQTSPAQLNHSTFSTSPSFSQQMTTPYFSTSTRSSLQSPSLERSQHLEPPVLLQSASSMVSDHWLFQNKSAQQKNVRNCSNSSATTLPLQSMPSLHVEESISIDQYGNCQYLTTPASPSPLMYSPLLVASPLVEQFRQSPYFEYSVSSALTLHSSISALSASHPPTLHSKCITKPTNMILQNSLKTEADFNFISLDFSFLSQNNKKEGFNKELITHESHVLHCNWALCDKTFSCLKEFFSHVNSHICGSKKPPAKYICKWIGCTRKSNGFDARYKLLTHIRTHTDEKPYQCAGCGKHFSRQEYLKIHIRSHRGEKSYVCPYEGCNKAYSNLSDKFKHVPTYKEARSYACKIPGCNKSYTDPSSLRKHMKSQSHYITKKHVMLIQLLLLQASKFRVLKLILELERHQKFNSTFEIHVYLLSSGTYRYGGKR